MCFTQSSVEIVDQGPNYPGRACLGCGQCVPEIEQTSAASNNRSIMDLLYATVCVVRLQVDIWNQCI